MPAAWPTHSDLTAYLADLGVTTTIVEARLTAFITSAVETLEEMSDRSPYLTDGSDVTEKFTLDGSDWLEIGVWTSITSIAIDGTTLTVDEDYWLEPYGGAYTQVRFASQWVTIPQTVVIVGKRGRTIPQRVYEAVLKWAAGEVFAIEATAGTVDVGEVVELRQENTTWKYAGGNGSMSTGDRLKSEAEMVFKRERRLGVGNWIG